MSIMTNPMEALVDYQRVLDSGLEIDPSEFDDDYLKRSGEIVENVTRFDYAKIVDKQVQALAMFVQEEPFKGAVRFSVAYAVAEKFRGRSLAVEAFNKGIADLNKILVQNKVSEFYVEALIDKTNMHSIRVAEKLFLTAGLAILDGETGTPALLFYRRFYVE